MVIQRAGLLLNDRIQGLSGYEIYLLLLAIHFHDVGNIYGREQHETRILEVMEELGQSLDLDTPAKKTVARIAMTHGGKINGSRDTISHLPATEYLQAMEIRPTLIASILRFADEIADDHSRAARFLLDADLLPKENEAFHHYSKCLQPVAVEGTTLIWKFDLPKEWATRTFFKENDNCASGLSRVYLYDELLRRVRKCLCELEYCSRFASPFIYLNSIRAIIQVHLSRVINPVFEDDIRMRIKGYPRTSHARIRDLLDRQPKAPTGRVLRQRLEGS